MYYVVRPLELELVLVLSIGFLSIFVGDLLLIVQIDVKRKGLFPIQPKPPQGFKDYLMNRCTYTLAGNSIPRLKRRNAEPPEGIPEGIRDLHQEQEAERYSLRMQVLTYCSTV